MTVRVRMNMPPMLRLDCKSFRLFTGLMHRHFLKEIMTCFKCFFVTVLGKKNIIIVLSLQVLIHLLDDTIQKGTLINYHKHYNIALFEVVVKMCAKLPLSTELVEYDQEV